jgi:hypothetical protein
MAPIGEEIADAADRVEVFGFSSPLELFSGQQV